MFILQLKGCSNFRWHLQLTFTLTQQCLKLITSMVNLCLLLKLLFKDHKKHEILSQISKEMHIGHLLFHNFCTTKAYGILGIELKVIWSFLLSMMVHKLIRVIPKSYDAFFAIIIQLMLMFPMEKNKWPCELYQRPWDIFIEKTCIS
jgi:hypothetical protein